MNEFDTVTDGDMDGHDFAESISLEAYGARLKQLRLMKQMSQTELAQKAKISVAMLSHIERAHARPSLQTLDRIRMALRLPLSKLLLGIDEKVETDRSVVVRATERFSLDSASPGVVKELLSPARPSNMEMMILVLSPEAHSGPEPWVRSGEKAGVVLVGQFCLTIGDQTFELGPGDSFQFDGLTPHRFKNLSPYETRILWIISPNSPG